MTLTAYRDTHVGTCSREDINFTCVHYTCTYACINTCTHTHTHVHMHYTHAHAHTHTHTQSCTHVTHARTHTHLLGGVELSDGGHEPKQVLLGVRGHGTVMEAKQPTQLQDKQHRASGLHLLTINIIIAKPCMGGT